MDAHQHLDAATVEHIRAQARAEVLQEVLDAKRAHTARMRAIGTAMLVERFRTEALAENPNLTDEQLRREVTIRRSAYFANLARRANVVLRERRAAEQSA